MKSGDISLPASLDLYPKVVTLINHYDPSLCASQQQHLQNLLGFKCNILPHLISMPNARLMLAK